MSSAAPFASQLAYCRAARRLRSRCADRPVDLYHSLRRLSDKADREPRSAAPSVEADELRPFSFDSDLNASIAHASSAITLTPAAMAFIPMIREALDGAILRYSARQRLLGVADRLGIGRFHANLLIALVQHEMQKRQPECAGSAVAAPITSRWFNRLAPIAIVFAVECIAAAALWRVLHA